MKILRLALLVGSGLLAGCGLFSGDFSQWFSIDLNPGSESVKNVTPDNIDDPNAPAKGSPAATQSPVRLRLTNSTQYAADCRITMEIIGRQVHLSLRRLLPTARSLVIGPDRADVIRIDVTFIASPPIQLETQILRIGRDFQSGDLIDVDLTLPPVDEPNEPGEEKPPPPLPPTIAIDGLDENILATVGDLIEFDLVTANAAADTLMAAFADPDEIPNNANAMPIAVDLPAVSRTTVIWNTAGVAPGTYVIRASLIANDVSIVADTPPGRVILAAAPILGACCYEDETCEITAENDCVGGVWLGANTSCDDCPTCYVPCPLEARLEGEPCGTHVNYGCITLGEPVFEPISCGETVCGTMWLDMFDPNDPNFPFDPEDPNSPFDPNQPIPYPFDYDWYEFSVSHDAEIEVTVRAEFPVFMAMLEQYEPGLPGCENLTGDFVWVDYALECESLTLEHIVTPGTYYLWLLPAGFDNFIDCDVSNRYTLTLECRPYVPLVGACCYGEYQCGIMTEDECDSYEGSYQGDGTTCEPNPCLPPVGACCYSEGVCLVMTEFSCIYYFEGTYMGDGTGCDPNPCELPPVEGACCFDGGYCLYLAQIDCESQQGIFQGPLVPCDPNPCVTFNEGDHCSNPIVIIADTQLPYSATDTTCGRGNYYLQTCLSPYDQGEEIVYQIVVQDMAAFSITVDPKGTPFTGMALFYDGCPGSDCVTATDKLGKGFPYTIGCQQYMPGTYYLMIDLSSSGGTCIPSFTISIDNCP